MAKENNYFDMFVEMVDISNQAAEKLGAILNDFQPKTLSQQIDALHGIESLGDSQKHQMMETLAKEFIAPIEREDIMDLANEIDDVTDSVEDVLRKIYMYNIQYILPEALEFMKLVRQCCKELHTIMREFSSFKKSKTIRDSIIELNRLEELGDKLYLDAVHMLYVQKGDPFETVAWTEVFNSFEKCCDTCEHVADVVSGVIMKNT